MWTKLRFAFGVSIRLATVCLIHNGPPWQYRNVFPSDPPLPPRHVLHCVSDLPGQRLLLQNLDSGAVGRLPRQLDHNALRAMFETDRCVLLVKQIVPSPLSRDIVACVAPHRETGVPRYSVLTPPLRSSISLTPPFSLSSYLPLPGHTVSARFSNLHDVPRFPLLSFYFFLVSVCLSFFLSLSGLAWDYCDGSKDEV